MNLMTNWQRALHGVGAAIRLSMVACAGAVMLAAGVAAAQSSDGAGQPGDDLPPLPPMPVVGGPAPALTVERILRAGNLESSQPDALSPSSLRGKVVVIEFWATWCAPCVGSIPHINDLVSRFKDQPVVFVSVSDEQAEPVEAFLTRRGIDGVVAVDTDRSVYLSYRIAAIPRTILVDSSGTIRAMIHPSQLSEALVQAVIDGRELESVQAEAAPTPVVASAQTEVVAADSSEPAAQGSTSAEAGGTSAAGTGEAASARTPGTVLYEVSLKASDSSSPRVEQTLNSLVARGCTGRDLVAEYNQMGPGVVVAEGDLNIDAEHYDAIVRMPDPATYVDGKGRGGLRGMLADAVERALGIETSRDRRIVPVLVLRPAASSPFAGMRDVSGSAGASSLSWGLGTISAIRQPASVLAERLGSMVRMPVADETGLTGMYDWTVRCSDSSVDAVGAAVEEQLGVRVEVQTRQMDVVVVRKRN